VGNYLENKLYVFGTKKARKNFNNRFCGLPVKWEHTHSDDMFPHYCFNALYPVPKDVVANGWSSVKRGPLNPSNLPAMMKQNTRRCGYDWEHAHYGCSAPQALELFHVMEGETCYYFETKNTAASLFVEGIAFKFPTLTFKYYYWGVDDEIAGELVIQGKNIEFDNAWNTYDTEGTEIVREHFDYEFDPHDFDDDEPALEPVPDNELPTGLRYEPLTPTPTFFNGEPVDEARLFETYNAGSIDPIGHYVNVPTTPNEPTIQIRRWEPLPPVRTRDDIWDALTYGVEYMNTTAAQHSKPRRYGGQR
jgi:hypothetical protein